MDLEFKVTKYGNFSVIKLSGRFIGKEAEDFLDEIEKSLDNTAPKRLIIDLSGLEYIGSQGAAALTALLAKYDVVLAGASAKVKSVLEMLKLDQIVKIYPTLRDALTHL